MAEIQIDIQFFGKWGKQPVKDEPMWFNESMVVNSKNGSRFPIVLQIISNKSETEFDVRVNSDALGKNIYSEEMKDMRIRRLKIDWHIMFGADG